jgi:galactokinase
VRTGAGWGGCTVSLVPEHSVPGFIATLRREYALYRGLDDGAFAEAVFATRPSSGAFGECLLLFSLGWDIGRADLGLLFSSI